METVTTSGAQLRQQEYDRILIPEDVPALGVEKGDEGIIRGLQLDNETMLAFVMVSYSQPDEGMVILEIKPENKVRSYTGD